MLDVKSSAAATLQHALVKHPLLVTVPRSSATGCTEDVKRKSFELECLGFKWNGFQQQSKRREHQRRLDIGYAWRSAKSWTWLRGRKWNGMHKPGLKNYMNVKNSHAALPHSCPCPLQPPTLTVLLSSHHSRALQMPYPMPCEHFEIEWIFPHLKFNFLLRTEKSSGSETEGFILQIENRNGWRVLLS